jgi:YD repeat-containing protein
VTEPASGGSHVWTISVESIGGLYPVLGLATSTGGLIVRVYSDPQLRKMFIDAGGGPYLYLHMAEYDSANNLTRSTRTSRFWHENGSAPTQGDGSVVQIMTYSPHGAVLTSSFQGWANSTTTTSYYNASKYFQQASVTDPLGRVTNFDYYDQSDANPGNRGNVKWVRDARYATTGKQFDYTYTSWGARATEKNLNDVFTHYFYEDAWSNLTKVVQDPGTGKLNRTTLMAYDVAGRVTSSTDPKGQGASFQYNAVGQPTVASFVGESISYGYGANGRTQTVTDNRGTTTIAYVAGTNVVQSVTDPVTGTVSYTTALSGERLTMTLPGGATWTYAYGTTGGPPVCPQDDPNTMTRNLSRVTDDQNRRVDYWLDNYGAVKRVRSNQTFDGSGYLLTYQKTEYFNELSAGSNGRRNLRQRRNSGG